MKVLFLTNNDNTIPLSQWLQDAAGETVLRFDAPLPLSAASKLKPDFIISYNYRHILKPDLVDAYRHRIVNLHISLLPWNRGTHQNLWAWLDGTPHGVTIHQIDEGLDTGPILLQRTLHLNPAEETLASSYQKLHESVQELFATHWQQIHSQEFPERPQLGPGTTHRSKDIRQVEAAIPGFSWDIPVAQLLEAWHKARHSNR